MNSLKKLQQKLKRLEAERNSDGSYASRDQDADNERIMSRTNSKQSSDEDNNFYSLYPKVGDIKCDQTEVLSTEQRVLKLEKQLEKMRKMLNEDKHEIKAKHSTPSKNSQFESRRSNTFESDTTLYDVDNVFSNQDDLAHRKRVKLKQSQVMF